MVIKFIDLYRFSFEVSSESVMINFSVLHVYGRKFITQSKSVEIMSFFFLWECNFKNLNLPKNHGHKIYEFVQIFLQSQLRICMLNLSTLHVYGRKFITQSRSVKIMRFFFDRKDEFKKFNL